MVIDNPFRPKDRISDCYFLVPLVGLDGPCCRALNWALFNLDPSLAQAAFLDVLFGKFCLTTDILEPRFNDAMSYATYFGSKKVLLRVGLDGYGALPQPRFLNLELYIEERRKTILRWEHFPMSQNEDRTFFHEWTSDYVGPKRIDFDQFAQTIYKFFKRYIFRKYEILT